MLAVIKQLLDEVEHDIMNYQNRVLCYQPKPKAKLCRGGGCFTLTLSVISSFLPKIRGAWISRAPPLKIYHCILSLLFMFPDKGFFIWMWGSDVSVYCYLNICTIYAKSLYSRTFSSEVIPLLSMQLNSFLGLSYNSSSEAFLDEWNRGC